METQSGNKRRADALDGEDKPVSLPVFTPITAPRITKASHSFLVQWRKDRREYEEKIRARCQTTGENEDEVITSVKNSIDDGLLTMLCKLRWRVKKEDLMEQRVIDEIEAIVSSVKNASLPDIRSLFSDELRMNLSETDVSERVLQYFKLCYDIIEDNGLAECFEGESGTKEKCKLLIANLEPAFVRDEVETIVCFQRRDALKDEVILHEIILEKALENQKSFDRREKARRDEPGTSAAGKSKKPKAKHKRSTPPKADKNGPEQKRIKEAPSSEKAKEPRDRGSAPADGCLKCGGDHWLSSCKIASDAEKISLPNEHAEKKAIAVLNSSGINIENQLERLAARESTGDDDPLPFEDDERTYVEDKEALMAAIEEMLVRALDNGFPPDLLSELRRIVLLYDVWRLSLGRDPPARVPPLKIRLKEGAKPFRCKPRNYPPHLRAFMTEFNSELEQLGWVVKNHEA